MAISRWTKARLQIVAVVTAIGAAIGIAISWLLSRILEFPYDVAEFEQGARNGLTIGRCSPRWICSTCRIRGVPG